MCGVVGFSCNNPTEENYNILYDIIKQSKIRGLHSFGYSYYDNKIITKKHHNIKDINLPKANKIIYHNRYSTSGDYMNHNNNQPIQLNNISLVFNGVLDMRTKQEIEDNYNIKMQTENDGEIIIQKCGNNIDKIKQFVSTTKGSFAGLMLLNNKFIAIRNSNRPLWKLEYKNATYYASTKDIFKRVNNNFNPTQLKPNKIYEN
tara:strand:+ start:167 stop:775 length:609 start_codon:yes stop_codon:yes gene_type:complete